MKNELPADSVKLPEREPSRLREITSKYLQYTWISFLFIPQIGALFIVLYFAFCPNYFETLSVNRIISIPIIGIDKDVFSPPTPSQEQNVRKDLTPREVKEFSDATKLTASILSGYREHSINAAIISMEMYLESLKETEKYLRASIIKYEGFLRESQQELSLQKSILDSQKDGSINHSYAEQRIKDINNQISRINGFVDSYSAELLTVSKSIGISKSVAKFLEDQLRNLTNLYFAIRALCLGMLGSLVTYMIRAHLTGRVLAEDILSFSTFATLITGAMVSIAVYGLLYTRTLVLVNPIADEVQRIPDYWRVTIFCLVAGAFSHKIYNLVADKIDQIVKPERELPRHDSKSA